MFQTNAFFDVNFVNPDLNTEKYGLKHGLKLRKILYFSSGLGQWIPKIDIIFGFFYATIATTKRKKLEIEKQGNFSR